MLATDEEHYAELAGRVHDTAEAAVADLLADLDLAETHRLVTELQDIDAARRRLTDGSYGICSDCSEPVGVERLSAYPVAKRCIGCQECVHGCPEQALADPLIAGSPLRQPICRTDAYPFTHTTGSSRATLRASPACSAASTTAPTSL